MSQGKRGIFSYNFIDAYTQTTANPQLTPFKIVLHSPNSSHSEISQHKQSSSEQFTRYPNTTIEKANESKGCGEGVNIRYVKGEGKRRKRDEKREKSEWTVEESKMLFELFKCYGSQWVIIAKHLTRHCENDIKNKFYTTLKRVATQAQLEDPVQYTSKFIKSKKNLIQFVDAAIKIGHMLSSRRGRKKTIEKFRAKTEGLLFPKKKAFSQPVPGALPLSAKEHMPYISDMCTAQPVLQYPLLMHPFSIPSSISPQFITAPQSVSFLPSHQLAEYQQYQTTFCTNGPVG
eukprot:TRINITY_DN7882_c0_g1_i20.p1 TRINITY_DN7882_c0_g1~~TRINITY_DN7882_c0_g1_i20.p1  ORF type:complete len:289 (-),score=22.55 TRINITY_DN7882_c0_g1_i20:193-1059(-)